MALLADVVAAHEELDPAGPILNVGKDRLAHVPDADQPAAEGDFELLIVLVYFFFGGREQSQSLVYLVAALGVQRIRVNARFPQLFQLGQPLLL
jgi:hypothetical protein